MLDGVLTLLSLLSVVVLETILVVYGVVESKAFAPARIFVEAWQVADGRTWLQGFIYCPYCVGFWVALGLSLLHDVCWPWTFTGPAAFIALLLFKRELYHPPYEAEREAVAAVAALAKEER
jgi:hypothetical protein